MEPTLLVAQGQCPATASDPRIDNGEMNSGGHVGKRVREDERSLQDVSRPDPVRHVDHPGVGGDRRDDPMTGTDEVVL